MSGKPGYRLSLETRQRQSLAQRGNKKFLGKRHTEETKQKIGDAHRNKIVSEETRKLLSASLKGKKWTLERRIEWSKRKTGGNNNNWKGGITPIRKSVRKSWKYRIWSEQVRKRDGKCMECGSREHLHAHHIERFLVAVDKQYDLANGITLCAKCHYKHHQGDGAYSNGKVYMEERANIA